MNFGGKSRLNLLDFDSSSKTGSGLGSGSDKARSDRPAARIESNRIESNWRVNRRLRERATCWRLASCPAKIRPTLESLSVRQARNLVRKFFMLRMFHHHQSSLRPFQVLASHNVRDASCELRAPRSNPPAPLGSPAKLPRLERALRGANESET